MMHRIYGDLSAVGRKPSRREFIEDAVEKYRETRGLRAVGVAAFVGSELAVEGLPRLSAKERTDIEIGEYGPTRASAVNVSAVEADGVKKETTVPTRNG